MKAKRDKTMIVAKRKGLSPPPLWGRVREGGRAALSEQGADPFSDSPVRPPTPTLPHKGGGRRGAFNLADAGHEFAGWGARRKNLEKFGKGLENAKNAQVSKSCRKMSQCFQWDVFGVSKFSQIYFWPFCGISKTCGRKSLEILFF